MKIKELKNKSGDELKKLADNFKNRLRILRFEERLGGKIKDNQEIKKVKKDIARILTLLNLSR